MTHRTRADAARENGRMANPKPLAERFRAGVDTSNPDGCWTWMRACTRDGYGLITQDTRIVRAHRVAWELENGPIPDGLCVCHRCDNRVCVRVSHLFLGTRAENLADMDRKGRRGRRLCLARRSEETVAALRAAREAGETFASIVKRMGISRSTIQRVLRGGRRKA